MVERTLIRPPSSRLGAISDTERAMVIAGSPLAGLYEAKIDRESAFEILKRKAETAAELEEPEEESANEREFSNARRYGSGTKYTRPTAKRSSRGDTATEAFAKSLARSFGTQLGRSLGRGTLGSFFKKL